MPNAPATKFDIEPTSFDVTAWPLAAEKIRNATENPHHRAIHLTLDTGTNVMGSIVEDLYVTTTPDRARALLGPITERAERYEQEQEQTDA
ncbi:hypothetical protein ACFWBS_38855 [Streptomyces mirabilis]|uniref:hypothetical protein n=1 Tax=Streptomyces mirabilis TaxID=68239 RepID=UPI0036674FFB